MLLQAGFALKSAILLQMPVLVQCIAPRRATGLTFSRFKKLAPYTIIIYIAMPAGLGAGIKKGCNNN
jgi:hypothetical protein